MAEIKKIFKAGVGLSISNIIPKIVQKKLFIDYTSLFGMRFQTYEIPAEKSEILFTDFFQRITHFRV